jgi:hypothetical protein
MKFYEVFASINHNYKEKKIKVKNRKLENFSIKTLDRQLSEFFAKLFKLILQL